MTLQPKAVERYECAVCGEEHRTAHAANNCAWRDLQAQCAQHDWEAGHTLGYLQTIYGFSWQLGPELVSVTKAHCFVRAHLQCCDKPAYRIVCILKNGLLRLWGIGGWMGGYGEEIFPGNLPTPHPAEELYVDKRANHLCGEVKK